MRKVIKTFWYSTLKGGVGILVAEGNGEKRAYIGKTKGDNPQEDEQGLINYGAKLSLSDAEDIVSLFQKKSYTPNFIVKELEDCKDIKEAIMRFKEQI